MNTTLVHDDDSRTREAEPYNRETKMPKEKEQKQQKQ
jgi:hypothetical protein